MRNRLYVPEWRTGVSLLDVEFAGQPFGKHSHEGFAIGAIESGVGGYRCRGTSLVFPERSMSLMNPDQAHTGYSVGGPVAYKMLYITESALSEILPARRRRGFSCMNPVDDNRWIATQLQAIAAQLACNDHEGRALAVDSLLTETLDQVMVMHGRERRMAGRRDSSPVRVVRDYLDTRVYACRHGSDRLPSSRVTLNSLASLVDLHPHYLLDIFRREMGIPPYTYWIQQRISAAMAELVEGCDSADVALRFGFYDQPHFTRCFKRMIGVSPGAVIRVN